MPKRKKTRSLLSRGSEGLEDRVGRSTNKAAAERDAEEEGWKLRTEVENGRSTEEETGR
ncbi:hypothetical protein GBAR_LOCUS30566 [Geodia barretti]|nr:hypothetical protein GBAR_LOCUS30566 [Geodia barretti]